MKRFHSRADEIDVDECDEDETGYWTSRINGNVFCLLLVPTGRMRGPFAGSASWGWKFRYFSMSGK